MQGIVDAITSFFRRAVALFTGGSPVPTNTQSISYFFYRVATIEAEFTAFTTQPTQTIQNDPYLSQANKDTLVAGIAGGWAGYQTVYTQMKNEASSGNAVVWICIWMVGPIRP
jgi:hypothetical protein